MNQHFDKVLAALDGIEAPKDKIDVLNQVVEYLGIFRFRVGDKVTINTDTVFDHEGIPVKVKPGTIATVDFIGHSMIQVRLEGGWELFGVQMDAVKKIKGRV